MKNTILILLLASTSCFGQFKLNYDDIRNENVENSINEKDETYDIIKVLNGSTNVRFLFTKKDHLISSIIFYRESGFSKKEIEDFKNKYLDNFKPTRIEKDRDINVYFDTEKEVMLLEDFSSGKTAVVLFTIDKETINPILKTELK